MGISAFYGVRNLLGCLVYNIMAIDSAVLRATELTMSFNIDMMIGSFPIHQKLFIPFFQYLYFLLVLIQESINDLKLFLQLVESTYTKAYLN